MATDAVQEELDEQMIEAPDVEVTYVLDVYKNTVLEQDPGYDGRVLDKMKAVVCELGRDFSKLDRGSGDSDYDSFDSDIKGRENAIEVAKGFFEFLKTQDQHKYDVLTLGGALYMSLKCFQEATYVYSPAEFLAESLYIMAFRNREDDAKSYKAIESTISCVLNRHIRELLWNLHRVAESVPEALEARFYYETPFDVDMDHLQALCEDAQITPTLDAAKFMCSKQRGSQGPSSSGGSKPCPGQGDQMEKLMNVVGPMVDAAQRAAQMQRGSRGGCN